MTQGNTSKVPVLMYHALEDDVHPSGAQDSGEQIYVLQVEQFVEQMEYLQKSGFVTFFLEELISMPQWPGNAIVITFDDGHQSNVSLALPVLEKFCFKAHFFITTGWINTPFYLTSRQVEILKEKGMQIGSHGATHRYFNEMNAEVTREELQISHDVLRAAVDKPVTSFSAPGGRITPGVIEVGKSLGYSVFCTSRVAMMRQGGDLENIPRFAMRSDYSLKNFAKIVHGDSLYHLRQTAKSTLLNLGKKVLGNQAYERIRLAVMSKH